MVSIRTETLRFGTETDRHIKSYVRQSYNIHEYRAV